MKLEAMFLEEKKRTNEALLSCILSSISIYGIRNAGPVCDV